MNIPQYLIKKYNIPVPRYTSYPPANFFHTVFTGGDIKTAIITSNTDQPENISFYIHIPFCAKLCLYCGCNTYISHNKTLIRQYTETLKREILLVKEMLNPGRRVSQVHWGGGTPNYLPATYIEEIMDLLYDNFQFIPQPEIAIECHPAHLTYDYIDRLLQNGFNRISLGVQDFDRKILKTVNRDAPAIPVEQLVTYIKKHGNISVNLDFIYGLPYQTEASFAATIEEAARIAPDRLVTFSYAHVPWIKKAQRILEKYPMPDSTQKVNMFKRSYQILTSAGYVSIGLDHYARPEDELSLALQHKTLHRNFQGYCTRKKTGQVYAFGVSGISQLQSAYFQNTKDLKRYTEIIRQNRLPVDKAYFLNDNEKIIRMIIDELMCNLTFSPKDIARFFNTSVKNIYRITAVDLQKLHIFEEEGLIRIEENKINITETGKFFIRNIASVFDPNMKDQTKKFSKAL